MRVAARVTEGTKSESSVPWILSPGASPGASGAPDNWVMETFSSGGPWRPICVWEGGRVRGWTSFR